MKNDGGSAFPVNSTMGMSLRDYFAAQVLPPTYERTGCNMPEYEINAMFGKSRTGIKREEIAAALAYRLADAMLDRRDSSL